jgi:hypothetical protein
MFIVQTLKIDRRQLHTRKLNKQITLTQYMQWVDFRSVKSSLLNSHLTYMVGTSSLIFRPSVMVAPSFVSECITSQCLSTRKRRRSAPHDNSRDSSSLIFRQGAAPQIESQPVAYIEQWHRKNALCFAGISLNSRSGKSQALDMSYIIAQVMLNSMKKNRHDLY